MTMLDIVTDLIGGESVDGNTIALALRGDREAQRVCTEAGYALPCAHCGSKVHMTSHLEAGVPSGASGHETTIKCLNGSCGATITRWALKKSWSIESALKAHNTRAPLPEVANEVQHVKD